MESNFKAGFEIAGMVLTTAAIAVIVIYCLGGFGVVSAGDVIYEQLIHDDSRPSTEHTCTASISMLENNLKIDNVGVKNKEALIGVEGNWIMVNISSDYFVQSGGYYSRYERHVPIYYSGSVIGNITHGYTYTGDKSRVFYQIYFEDFNEGAMPGSGAFTLNFTQLPGSWSFGPSGREFNYFSSSYSQWLDTNEFIFYLEDGYSDYFIGQGTAGGDPSHLYSITKRYNFFNRISIEEANDVGLHPFRIQREGFSADGLSIASRYEVWDGSYRYLNMTSTSSVNQTIYLLPTFCAETLHYVCHDDIDTDNGWSYIVEGVCEVPEPGYFDLSGYTRSVQGNLVPDVLLTAQSQTERSNNISFYEFENLDTGSFTLAWNKTGYLNDSVLMYIGTPGDYQRDVYLIPVDMLDTGEFGGVVYDYCTHESIGGAYVYLFNETADSGKYAYSNKYGFYRFAGMTTDMDYEVSATKDGYDASIVHSFTFNESNINETHCKTKNIWLLPVDGCPEDGGIPTPPPAPTPTPHEWTNEEIVSQLRILVPSLFFIVLFVTFMWFLRKAGGAKR